MTTLCSVEADAERIAEVERRVGLRKTRIYELINEGQFPAAVKIGGRSYWIIAEVTAWLQRHVDERDSNAAAQVAQTMNRALQGAR